MKNKMVTIKHEKHLLWARHCADFKCIISCNLHKNSMEVINQVHILTIIFLLHMRKHLLILNVFSFKEIIHNGDNFLSKQKHEHHDILQHGFCSLDYKY